MRLRFVRSTYRALDKSGSKEMKLLVVTLHHITAPGRHRIVSKPAVHCSSAENVRPRRWWQVLGRVDCGPAGEDRLCTGRREIHHLRKTPLVCVVFLLFVPSLSWQTIDFHQRLAFLRTFE